VRGLFDKIIVVDTGSTDRTVEIARSFGARVFDFVWVDDFGEQFCSVDMGIYGHLTRRNPAALARERGDHEAAALLWAEVLAECPGDREAQAMLARLTSVEPAR
jgi:hypothetical protein